jgi:transposase InsO family protein
MAARIIRDGHYWPTLHKDIQEAIASCHSCTAVETRISGFHPARTIDALLPGDHYQIDLATMPLSEDGHRYMFVLVDVFSGFVILRPMKDKKKETIARTLWEVCAVIGFPRILQSDNGTEFVNAILKALIQLFGITHRTISAYNPRADGKVERSVRTVKQTLRKLLQGAYVYWPLHLPFIQFTYNDKVQDITGATAFSVMFGRLPNKLESYQHDNFAELPPATAAWKAHQDKLVSIIFPAISHRRKDVQDKYRQRMDKIRRHVIKETLPKGTLVALKDPLYLANPKLRPSTEPEYVGQYTVERRSPHGPYYLRDETGAMLARSVPLDQMKIIRKPSKYSDAESSVDDSAVYAAVKRITKHRRVKGATGEVLQYWVEWKDDSPSGWVAADGFMDTDVIRRYYAEKNALNEQH